MLFSINVIQTNFFPKDINRWNVYSPFNTTSSFVILRHPNKIDNKLIRNRKTIFSVGSTQCAQHVTACSRPRACRQSRKKRPPTEGWPRTAISSESDQQQGMRLNYLSDSPLPLMVSRHLGMPFVKNNLKN